MYLDKLKQHIRIVLTSLKHGVSIQRQPEPEILTLEELLELILYAETYIEHATQNQRLLYEQAYTLIAHDIGMQWKKTLSISSCKQNMIDLLNNHSWLVRHNPYFYDDFFDNDVELSETLVFYLYQAKVKQQYYPSHASSFHDRMSYYVSCIPDPWFIFGSQYLGLVKTPYFKAWQNKRHPQPDTMSRPAQMVGFFLGCYEPTDTMERFIFEEISELPLHEALIKIMEDYEKLEEMSLYVQ